MKKAFMMLLSVVPISILIYWFNLDNKLIYYVVRPVLNWNYDRQERDVRL